MRCWQPVATAFAGVAAVLLAACSAPGHRPGIISVVTSTNVYGDIVEQLAGSLAGHKIVVTEIISDPAIDPHDYEANARNELAISRADLIVENGGGYDGFVDTLRDAAGADADVVSAVEISGMDRGGDGNEHVWYDFPTVAKVVARVAQFLITHDRSDAAQLRANAQAFTERLRVLEATEARIKSAYDGTGVAITEPVPLYLLAACGLVDRTPTAFTQAVEDGTDVAPRILDSTLGLFSAKEVALLAYNAQTSGVATDRVIDAARDNDIPVVPVTETLPADTTYLAWMHGILAAVDTALTGA